VSKDCHDHHENCYQEDLSREACGSKRVSQKIAGENESRPPNYRRQNIGNVEAPRWHVQDPRCQRNYSPERSKKPPDENAGCAVAFEKDDSTFEPLWVMPKRPHV
jgi:hypothetical protein